MSIDCLVDCLSSHLRARPRLVRLESDRPVVFIGDTHGDREATEQVLKRFSVPKHTLVFLGDTVDRGSDSLGNLELIVSKTMANPDSIHLLMGNHEAWTVASFQPADFWEGLDPADAVRLGDVLSRLPLAAWHPTGALALHGAIPDVPSLEALGAIELGSEAWRAATWGDWRPSQGGGLPTAGWRRPSFDRGTFERRLARLDGRILVRSHQPSAPTYLFNDRCLTLFTSSAYGDGRRRVAVLRPNSPLGTARDLELIEI